MKTVVLFCCLFVGVFSRRDYLQECVTSFEPAIVKACQNERTQIPCFNNLILDEYGEDPYLAATHLSFECCDLGCTSAVFDQFCCHDSRCQRRCAKQIGLKHMKKLTQLSKP